MRYRTLSGIAAEKYDRIFFAVWLMFSAQILGLLDQFGIVNLPLLRYGIVTLATVLWLGGIYGTRYHSMLAPRGYYGIIARSLIAWSLLMILRGIPEVFSGADNFMAFKRLISGQFLTYCIPFIILVDLKLYLIKRLLKLSLVLASVYVIVTTLFFGYFASDVRIAGVGFPGEIFAAIFAGSVAIICLTFPYHSSRVNFVAFAAVFLALVVNAILARRNQVLYFGGVCAGVAYLMLLTSSPIVRRKRVGRLIGSLMLVLCLGGMYTLFSSKFSKFFQKAETGFKNREFVLKEFRQDFDRNGLDWIVGRGINGVFRSESLGFMRGHRDVIENGYYYLILKGGWIYLALTVVASLVAVIKGLFLSKNLISKAFAVIVLVQLIEMIGFGLPSVSVKYVWVWVAIGACFSNQLLNRSDFEIRGIIGLR